MNDNEIESTTTAPVLPAAWSTLRRELATRRQAYLARQQLRRDLSSYTSQADLDDLYAVLDRHDDSDAAVVRHILNQQRIRAA